MAFCGVEAGQFPAFKEVVAGSEEQEAWYRYCGGGKWDHLPINQRPEETSYAMEISLLADAPAPAAVYVSTVAWRESHAKAQDSYLPSF